MILTVTMNPAIDLFTEVDSWVFGGEVNRARRTWRQIGGKGINVSRTLKVLGMRTSALILAGRDSSSILSALMAKEPFPIRAVEVIGETRTNIHVINRGLPDSLKVNQAGAAVPDALQAILPAFEQQLAGIGMVVLSGSLPRGCPAGAYAQLTALAAENRVPVLIDAEGPALLEAISSKPAIVKFNRKELEATMGRRLESEAEVIHAMAHLRIEGAGIVVVTDGGKVGWSVESTGRTMRFVPPSITPVHTNGAGDAFTAGVAVGLRWGWDLKDSIRLAMAAGAAQCLNVKGEAMSAEVENLIGRGVVEVIAEG